jgi:hypothetical protein
MDTMQAHATPKAGEIMPAVQTAFENWTKLNTKLTQMFLDASIAQVSRLQDYIRLPAAQANGNGSAAPQKLWHVQVDEMKRQMEESIGMSRQIADEARHAMFEMASTMLEVPLAAQEKLTQTLAGAGEKIAGK